MAPSIENNRAAAAAADATAAFALTNESAGSSLQQRSCSSAESASASAATACACNACASCGVSELLLLFLRVNDGVRLDSSAGLHFLSLRDVHQLRLLSRGLRRKLARVEYDRCRDGREYLVPYPGYPGVLSTPSDVRAGAGLFRHQLASLRAMHRAENRATEFGALRGGILGDAPGLGKTITMLAHVASTAGLRPKEPEEFYDGESLRVGWNNMRTNVAFTTEVLSALKPLRKRVGRLRGRDAGRVQAKYRDLERFVVPPYPDGRLRTLDEFERHVRRTVAPFMPQAELELFRRNVQSVKAGLDKRNRQFFCSERGRRLALERDLIPCSSTLVVVPDALLEHWAEQIRRHLNLEMLAEKNNCGGSRGVVYIDGVGDLSEARFPLNYVSLNGGLDSVFHLMRHLIVVVPFSRCEQEYKKEVRAGRMQGNATSHGSKRRRDTDASYIEQSPLLRLRWLRLVVDEGHELGTHEAESGTTRFINQLAAERRWVLSGTPTTGDEDSPEFTATGLRQLQRLLFFLRHPVYGTLPPPSRDISSVARLGSFQDNERIDDDDAERRNKDQAKEAWSTRVMVPFLRRNEDGRAELFRVLQEVMVMHRKEDVHLPKPIFKQGEVNVSVPDDIQSKLVEAACAKSRNVSTYSSMLNGMDVDMVRNGRSLREKLQKALKGIGSESIIDVMLSAYLSTVEYQILVDEAQGKYISDSVKMDRRLLLERGGPLALDYTGPLTESDFRSENWIDRRPVKAVVYSESHTNLLSVTEHLYQGLQRENIAELYAGGIGDMSSELSRFRNGCKEGRECPVCGGWNEIGGKRRIICSSILLEVVDFQNQNQRFLIEPERIIRALGVGDFDESGEISGNVELSRLQGAPLTKYGLSQKCWRQGDVLEIDVRDPHPLLPARWSNQQWEEHGSEKCIGLAARDRYEGQDWFFGPLPRCEEDIDRVVVRLVKWQSCGRFHNPSRWYKGPFLADAPVKTVQEDVFVLCLNAQLAHGLDLSFVTHLFLLEPIDDAALLEQVTSRAHRLGATGPVVIETVNVWQEMGIETKAKISREGNSSIQDQEKRTGTAVCEHCYRSFESMEKAQQHELKCDRNPDSAAIVDPFHLSSVYRDIRPPPPLEVDGNNEWATDV